MMNTRITNQEWQLLSCSDAKSLSLGNAVSVADEYGELYAKTKYLKIQPSDKDAYYSNVSGADIGFFLAKNSSIILPLAEAKKTYFAATEGGNVSAIVQPFCEMG